MAWWNQTLLRGMRFMQSHPRLLIGVGICTVLSQNPDRFTGLRSVLQGARKNIKINLTQLVSEAAWEPRFKTVGECIARKLLDETRPTLNHYPVLRTDTANRSDPNPIFTDAMYLNLMHATRQRLHQLLSQGAAVLITGPKGSGAEHMVRRYLETHSAQPLVIHYKPAGIVSLDGLVDDLYHTLVQEPGLGVGDLLGLIRGSTLKTQEPTAMRKLRDFCKALEYIAIDLPREGASAPTPFQSQPLVFFLEEFDQIDTRHCDELRAGLCILFGHLKDLVRRQGLSLIVTGDDGLWTGDPTLLTGLVRLEAAEMDVEEIDCWIRTALQEPSTSPTTTTTLAQSAHVREVLGGRFADIMCLIRKILYLRVHVDGHEKLPNPTQGSPIEPLMNLALEQMKSDTSCLIERVINTSSDPSLCRRTLAEVGGAGDQTQLNRPMVRYLIERQLVCQNERGEFRYVSRLISQLATLNH